MESSTQGSHGYSASAGASRINEILSGVNAAYEEVDSIPSRDKLTFTNGFYVNCSTVWIDLRDSSGLTAKYNRPTLARIYRSYISEMVAVLHLSERCVEVNIAGDGVCGVFDTPFKSHIDSTFETIALGAADQADGEAAAAREAKEQAAAETGRIVRTDFRRFGPRLSSPCRNRTRSAMQVSNWVLTRTSTTSP